jgi:hypothetical protein
LASGEFLASKLVSICSSPLRRFDKNRFMRGTLRSEAFLQQQHVSVSLSMDYEFLADRVSGLA